MASSTYLLVIVLSLVSLVGGEVSNRDTQDATKLEEDSQEQSKAAQVVLTGEEEPPQNRKRDHSLVGAKSCASYIGEAMDWIQQGYAREAAKTLTEGLHHYPHDASMWQNLGVAQAINSHYCQAEAAASIALRLGHQEAVELLNELKPLGVWPCPHLELKASLEPVLALREKAALAPNRGRGSLAGNGYLKAVRESCTEDTLVVEVAESELENGALTPETLHTLTAIFDVCGAVAIRNMFPVDQVDRAAVVQAEHFFDKSGDRNKGVDNKRRGDQLRQEVTLPLVDAFTSLTSSAGVLKVVQNFLQSSDIELDTFSYIQSEPGSSDQAWHADMSPIIDEDRSEGSLILPPYGLVMVVPFVDLDEPNGPTEFIPGSHLPPMAIKGGVSSYWHVPETGEANPYAATISLKLPKGSALFFDIRTTHRGRANNSLTPRPILYASYFREWFIDRVNFEGRQSQWWHNLNEMREEDRNASRDQLKKLYSRVDSRQYTKMLEDLLIEKGVDISKLEA